jgi:hypothetical protein
VYYSEATFHFGFRWETSASFAARFVEKIRFSRKSLLPDGFARHITEVENILVILSVLVKFEVFQGWGV